MSRAKLSSVCRGLSIVVFLASSTCVRKNENLDRSKPVEIDLPAAKQPANFDSIRAIVDAADKGNEHKDIKRPGTCTTACDVPITIFSRGLTKNIKSDVAISKMQVIGEMINTDPTNTENAYKLKPNTRYLIWVAPASQQSAKDKNEWGLFELPNQAKGTSDRKTVGLVTSCHTYDNALLKSDVDFKPPSYCDPKVSSRVYPATEASMWSSISEGWAVFRWAANRAGMLRLPLDLPEVWFECGSGCCTATGVVL